MMTAEERDAIRAVLDANARRLYEADSTFLFRCAGCGGERSGWTLGCSACASRHHRRAKEGTHPDIVYYRERSAMALAHSAMLKTERQRGVMWGNRNLRSGIRGKPPTVPGRRSYL